MMHRLNFFIKGNSHKVQGLVALHCIWYAGCFGEEIF